MDLLLVPLAASPLVGIVAALAFAVGLMALVAAVAAFAGLYYSGPRFAAKWLSRRALRGL